MYEIIITWRSINTVFPSQFSCKSTILSAFRVIHELPLDNELIIKSFLSLHEFHKQATTSTIFTPMKYLFVTNLCHSIQVILFTISLAATQQFPPRASTWRQWQGKPSLRGSAAGSESIVSWRKRSICVCTDIHFIHIYKITISWWSMKSILQSVLW